jgi:RHS repeat-associated protein
MNRSSNAYAYDLAGNREQVVDSGVTTNYTPNAVNAYTAISGSANPTYDPNGNLLTGPIAAALASLTYDRENRLTTSNLGGSVNSYTYDALGRISTLTYSLNGVSTTEVYTWTGWTLLYRELIQNAVVVEKFRYTWGLDVSGTLEGAGGVGGLLAIERNVNNHYSWDIRYPHYDANGNIMALSNSSGQISARYRNDAFGKTILSTDVDGSGWNTKNIHGFSTKPTLGNHKLHYYGYRWYDSSNGRWINRDPIEEEGGLNLYGFVGNNGLDKWDLLGLLKFDLDEYPFTIKEAATNSGADECKRANGTWTDYLNPDSLVNFTYIGVFLHKVDKGAIIISPDYTEEDALETAIRAEWKNPCGDKGIVAVDTANSEISGTVEWNGADATLYLESRLILKKGTDLSSKIKIRFCCACIKPKGY